MLVVSGAQERRCWSGTDFVRDVRLGTRSGPTCSPSDDWPQSLSLTVESALAGLTVVVPVTSVMAASALTASQSPPLEVDEIDRVASAAVFVRVSAFGSSVLSAFSELGTTEFCFCFVSLPLEEDDESVI